MYGFGVFWVLKNILKRGRHSGSRLPSRRHYMLIFRKDVYDRQQIHHPMIVFTGSLNVHQTAFPNAYQIIRVIWIAWKRFANRALQSVCIMFFKPVLEFDWWLFRVTLPRSRLDASQVREPARPLGFMVQLTYHPLSESLTLLPNRLFNSDAAPRLRKEFWNYVSKLCSASDVYAVSYFLSLQMCACHFQDAPRFPQILRGQIHIYFLMSQEFPKYFGSLKSPPSNYHNIICTVDGNGGDTYVKCTLSRSWNTLLFIEKQLIVTVRRQVGTAQSAECLSVCSFCFLGYLP